MTYRKKLIEVALPLDDINREAAREKSIRHGHPSTLHLWWARRPLAACRAVLFASLVDDPSNDLPEDEAMVERERLFEIIRELVKWENSSDEAVLGRAREEILHSTGGNSPKTKRFHTGSSVTSTETAMNRIIATSAIVRGKLRVEWRKC